MVIPLGVGAWQQLRDLLGSGAAVDDRRPSPSWAPALAVCSPVMEAAAGVMLLIPKTATRWAADGLGWAVAGQWAPWS